MQYDVIIIGAGPVGLYGTFYASLNNLKTLLIEIDSIVGGAPRKMYPEKDLYDLPGFDCINGNDFIINIEKQLHTQKNWDLQTNVEIQTIIQTDDGFKLIDTKQKEYFAKYVIFSMGYGSFKFKSIHPQKINMKNNHHNIHHQIKNLNEYEGKDIIICGGGNTAIDYANMLHPIVKSLKIIHHSDKFKALEENINKLKSIKNVEIMMNTEIQNVSDTHIECSYLDNKHNLNYDFLLVFYGVEQINNVIYNHNWFNKQRKIEVNDMCESILVPNLYACGACNNKNLNNLMIHGFSQIACSVDNIIAKRKAK